MKNIIIPAFIVLTAVMFLFISKSFSQGCMGGGGDGVNLKGFIQPQFNYFLNGEDDEGNSLNENNFTFNRARIGVLGSIPYDIDYYFFIETSSFKTPGATPHLLDAYVSYTRFGKWAKVSLGQFKSSFSQEQNTSCSGLYTVNRSEVVNQLAGPQRDLGMLISGGNDTMFISYNLGLMNGTGLNVADNNNNKEIVGRLVIKPLDFLSVGGSLRLGKTNPTDAAEKLNNIMRYGGEIQFMHKGILFQSEIIIGEDKLYSSSKIPIYGGCGGIVGYDTKVEGTYKKGGYLFMAAYKTKWNIEPVVKFDSWDPDFDSPEDWSNYITYGINYYVNDYSRLQINYVNVTEGVDVDNDMFMIQLQAKF